MPAPVMRPHDYDKKRQLIFPQYLSPKLDGLRGEFYDGTFWTKTGKPIHGLYEQTAILRPLQKVHLTGELLVPGWDFDKSSGYIRGHGVSPLVVFHVFDAPGRKGEFRTRLQWLTKTLPKLNDKRIVPVSHMQVHTYAQVERMYRFYLTLGLEGIVLKTPYHLYQDGRSWDWVRMKPFQTVDVIVEDRYEGTGKHAGRLGGFIVRNPSTGVLSKVGGGFSDKERYFFWTHFESYRGRTCEITFQRATKLGRYRHPNFIRFRTD